MGGSDWQQVSIWMTPDVISRALRFWPIWRIGISLEIREVPSIRPEERRAPLALISVPPAGVERARPGLFFLTHLELDATRYLRGLDLQCAGP
jgi:hypothetical protein